MSEPIRRTRLSWFGVQSTWGDSAAGQAGHDPGAGQGVAEDAKGAAEARAGARAARSTPTGPPGVPPRNMTTHNNTSHPDPESENLPSDSGTSQEDVLLGVALDTEARVAATEAASDPGPESPLLSSVSGKSLVILLTRDKSPSDPEGSHYSAWAEHTVPTFYTRAWLHPCVPGGGLLGSFHPAVWEDVFSNVCLAPGDGPVRVSVQKVSE